MYKDTDISYWQKQILKQNIKMEFLTIYCFGFLLKMKPWGLFQVNEATNVVMILGGCFISEIVLNLSFRWVKKILVKSDSMFTLACEQVLQVRVSQSEHWTINFHWWKTSFVQSKAVNDDFSPSEILSFLMPIGYC